MKRSEMLEVMDKAVAQWHLLYVGNPDGYTCNMHILKKMEEAGMLPTPIKKEVADLNDEGISFTVVYNFRPNEESGDHESNWEKE